MLNVSDNNPKSMSSSCKCSNTCRSALLLCFLSEFAATTFTLAAARDKSAKTANKPPNLYPCVVLHPPPVVPAAMAVASAGLLYYIIPPLVVRDARDARNARACFSRRPEFVRQLHKRLINFQLHPKKGGRGPIHHWSFLRFVTRRLCVRFFAGGFCTSASDDITRRADGPTEDRRCACVCVCVRVRVLRKCVR